MRYILFIIDNICEACNAAHMLVSNGTTYGRICLRLTFVSPGSKCSKLYPHSYVILYADDILLLATTVTLLDRLFAACEIELTHLDMAIN